MIVGTMVNSMMAYMSLFHFEEAEKCINFVLESYMQQPDLYYRKAQVLYFNQKSSFENLEDANYILKEYCLSSSKPQRDLKKYKEL